MFETEMSIINTSLINVTIKNDDTISLQKIQRMQNIPRAIKVFFKTEVENWLKAERDAVPSLKRFNTHIPEIDSLQQQIDFILVSKFEFERIDFLATLDKAIHFYFNYLLRPEWMLINFMYEKTSSISVKEMLTKLQYCTEYLYYNTTLERYFAEKGLASIRVDEFRHLIHKIDDHVVSIHNSIELARMTTPIFDFLNFGKLQQKDEVNIDALVVFFGDKRLDSISERLEKEKSVHNIQSFSVWQLASIIEKVRSGNEDAEIENPEPEETAAQASDLQIDASIDLGETNVTTEPEAESVQNKSGKKGSTITSETPHSVTPIKVFDENSILENESTRLPDIRKLISVGEQKKIVKKIFRKNDLAFAKAVYELNKRTTWKEAAAYLDDLFISNNIDPYSKDAERFADIVYSRYPEEKKKQAQ